MKTLRVVAPGFLTTVQDLGREGFGPIGVSATGAGDAVSLRAGNRLVGNPQGAAGLEMTLVGGTFEFPGGAVIALAGSEFGATVGGATVPAWTAVEVKAGQVLTLGPTQGGARSYLCVRGGIEVDKLLGSASTHILSGLGGMEGRALKREDVLRIGDAGEAGEGGGFTGRTVAGKPLEKLAARKVLRATEGPQSDWFPEPAQKVFYGSTYRVTEEANRMGLRLEGPAIGEGSHGEMITEGVSLGAVQITAAGLPIILFVEQQTTGGYAKIANVISADLHSVGQLRPRDEIRFEKVDWETARKLFIEQEELLASKELIDG